MSTSVSIESYFKRLDMWRHFPAYRLEPRVDVFFSLYLREVLELYCNDEILDFVIPELPVSKALIYAKDGYTGRDSIKVDFMLLNTDFKTAYLVELKTDEKSIREKQNEDLEICSGLTLNNIIEEIIQIILRTGERRKYMHLLNVMELNQLMIVPKQVYDLAFSSNSKGLANALNGIEINPLLKDTNVKVVFVRPLSKSSCTTINFEMFYDIVSKYEDPISLSFAKYLLNWGGIAGDKLPEY